VTMAALAITDVSMYVHYKRGEYIKEDVNCDSTFMLKSIQTVGKAIRKAFHWAKEETIFLHKDNARGHGTADAIDEYTRVLKEEYNIQIVHQIPRSPETNVLDIGMWCCLQWAVDSIMRGHQGNIHALNKDIYDVWQSKALSMPFSSVWKRLGRVLHLIKEDNGGNELVEQKRGKKWAALDEPMANDIIDNTAPAFDNTALPAAAAATTAASSLPAAAEGVIDLLEDDEDDEFDDSTVEEVVFLESSWSTIGGLQCKC